MSTLSQVQELFNEGKLKEAMAQVEIIDEIISPENPEFFDFKLLKAKILLELGKYEEGEKLLNNMLDFGRRGGLLLRIDMIILLSDILWRKGNWDQAFFMIEMGEYDFTKLGMGDMASDKDLRYAELKRLKGIYHRYSGELDLAVEYFQESLVTAEGIQDKRLLAKIYNLLGLAMRETGELSRSWYFYDKSKEIYQELNDEIGVGTTLFNFASLKEYIGDISDAIKDYEEALDISEKVANLRLQANVLSALGILKLKTGDFKDGIRMVNAGLTLKTNLGNDLDSALTFYQFITYLISTEQEALVPIYFDEMERIWVRNQQNILIDQYYLLIEAGINQTNLDLSDVDKAKRILDNIINSSVIDMQLTIHALVSKCNLLLNQLLERPSQLIFEQAMKILDHLDELLLVEYTIPLDIEVSVLKAKMCIFGSDYKKAQQFVNSSLALIESKNLRYLERETLITYNFILENVKDQRNTQLKKAEFEPPELTENKGILFIVTDNEQNILINIQLDQDNIDEETLNLFLRKIKSQELQSLYFQLPVSKMIIEDSNVILTKLTNIMMFYFYQGDNSISEIQKLDKLVLNLSNIYSLNNLEDVDRIDEKLIIELLN